MDRREFIRNSVGSAIAISGGKMLAAAETNQKPVKSNGSGTGTKLAAYYIGANVYTCVPRHIRNDMEWMADKGTHYVFTSVLEQDLFASYENLAMIIAEASRVGMQVLAVPSRWGGLVAGAPKVPSLFSVLNPKTWMVNEKGTTKFMAQATGAISSVHSPETFKFFCDSLTEMYRQLPQLAGFVIDEPKCFLVDYSKMAIAALGENAPETAHYAAAGDFFSRVCAFAKEKWPDKFTLMFQQAHLSEAELAAGAAVKHLDFYGVDGRPWTLEDDTRLGKMPGNNEVGRGKVLLSGKGEAFIKSAHSVEGRKSFFLAENHNMRASMVDAMEHNYASVLALRPDIFTYYYYPRNVEGADRAMEIIGRNLKQFSRSS
jgi:hypothetical protein